MKIRIFDFVNGDESDKILIELSNQDHVPRRNDDFMFTDADGDRLIGCARKVMFDYDSNTALVWVWY